MVTCQRMGPDLVEGILESQRNPRRRQQRDMRRVRSDSLGAALALDGDAGLSESDTRLLPVQRDEATTERWRDRKSWMISEPLFPGWLLEGTHHDVARERDLREWRRSAATSPKVEDPVARG